MNFWIGPVQALPTFLAWPIIIFFSHFLGPLVHPQSTRLAMCSCFLSALFLLYPFTTIYPFTIPLSHLPPDTHITIIDLAQPESP